MTKAINYVMVGVKLEFGYFHDALGDEEADTLLDIYSDNAFDGVMHHNGLCIVTDTYNSNYTMVGRVIEKKDCIEGFSLPIEIAEEKISPLRQEVAKLLAEHLSLEAPDVQTWVFTHYR